MGRTIASVVFNVFLAGECVAEMLILSSYGCASQQKVKMILITYGVEQQAALTAPLTAIFL